MSFLVAAALGVGFFVVLPVAAHLLRRGKVRERPFPPAALVPAARSVARERARVEDRLLLLIRALAILCLAVIGATPFVRCSRLSLARSSGASVAFAVVLDDSHSMRSAGTNGTRFDRALGAARELLGSAREGDAIAIVLAGKPARLALAATTDLSAARRALTELAESDRSTDLDGAVELARSSLASLSHHDKRVVVLSDLAGAPLPDGDPPLWLPVPELTEVQENCGICSAERHGRRIEARIACTSAAAAAGRALTLKGSKGGEPAALASRAGVQDLGLDLDPKLDHPEVELTGGDALASDDRAAVSAESAALGVLVVADTANDSAETGGAPVLEQALAALQSNAALHPLALLPDSASELAGNSLVLLDDPPGITPEARSALATFVEQQGGIAAAFLGPRAEQTPLGSTLEPFVHGAVHWESNAAGGIDDASLAWLGPEAASVRDLALHGRAGLGAADLLGAKVLATFGDKQPFLTERALGRGELFTIALPTSVEQSDFPLRPAFLALLDYLLNEAQTRRGVTQNTAGGDWIFPPSANVTIEGPRGKLTPHERVLGGASTAQKAFTPALAGRYAVTVDDHHEERVATLDPVEITTLPEKPKNSGARARSNGVAGSVDASPELGFVALALLALELGLRAFRRMTRERDVTSAPAQQSRAS